MRLDEFIMDHQILNVGTALPGYLCTDLIVDDPDGLVTIAAESGYYISDIQWWERALIKTGSHLGMGGPPDPRAPEEFFFSEVTHIGRQFHSATAKEDYLAYIRHVKDKYPSCELYPSFDIQKT